MRRLLVSPVRIHSLIWAHTHTQVLKTSLELDVFSLIAGGHQTVQEIAKASRTSKRGMEMLLNANVGLGLLRKNGDEYELTEESRQFLVKGSPLYMGKIFSLRGVRENHWGHLTKAVKKGKPVKMRFHPGKKFWTHLVEAIFPGSYLKAKTLLEAWKVPQRKEVYRILDVAAGSGAWSIPFADRYKRVRVTALDYPEVLTTTRKYARKYGVSSQYSYLPGDLEVLPFGKETYDLIILGNICHSLGVRKSQRLFQKSYEALKNNGHIVIAETLPNENREGPLFPLLFALNMLLHSVEGNTFTLKEYRDWLTKAGFRSVKTIRISPAPSPLILAKK